jgi:hypothetical protein
MEEPSIADILAELKSQKEEIKELVNSKVSSLRDEIQGATASATSELKKFKGQNEITWKSKGHKIQFNFNLDIQESLDSINWAIDNGKFDYAKELLKEAGQKIKERNKHIRIADSSSGGWETVANPVASDSDDESKIYRAENRALKKRKTERRPGTGKESNLLPLPQIRFRVMLLLLFLSFHVPPHNRNNSKELIPFVSVGAMCAGILPTYSENARSSCRTDPRPVQPEDRQRESKVQSDAHKFVKDEYLTLDNYEFESRSFSSPKLKGRLKSNLQFWETIGAYDSVLDVIKNGYRIPFYSMPRRDFHKNNNSSLLHKEFVDSAITELLNQGLIEQCIEAPYIVNPLTVSVQSNNKKRLILNLRCVNIHVLRQSVKYEDIRTALLYLKANAFMFSFDLHSAYHHIEFFYPHTEFLGFSCVRNGEQQFFKFLVLPFGLKAAPYVFTKVTRPLIKKWRGEGKCLIMYLDDGIGIGNDFHSTRSI